jgi:hypothetical protein
MKRKKKEKDDSDLPPLKKSPSVEHIEILDEDDESKAKHRHFE